MRWYHNKRRTNMRKATAGICSLRRRIYGLITSLIVLVLCLCPSRGGIYIAQLAGRAGVGADLNCDVLNTFNLSFCYIYELNLSIRRNHKHELMSLSFTSTPTPCIAFLVYVVTRARDACCLIISAYTVFPVDQRAMKLVIP